MCGINGSIGGHPEIVQNMNTATRHRGPDGSGTATFGGVTFGHNRLAIIDLSAEANQPMTSACGRYTIVFNGEIYNFADLKQQLPGINFKTSGDTEVLLEAYARWGISCVSKVRGIFAFAIYDRHDESVTLVRDHMGVKPLYYAQRDGALYFSSEISGLIAAGFNTLNPDTCSLFLLSQFVPSPYTVLRDVYKLEPSQYVICTSGNLSTHFYERPTLDTTGMSLVDVIDDAVTTQLVSDRPIGLYVSGGIDSTVVLHHMKAKVDSLETYTMRFGFEQSTGELEQRFNYDADAALRSAKQYGTKHTEFVLTGAMVAKDLVGAFSGLDEPVANPTTVTRYFMSRWVRQQGVVVAFGGDGGDEYFLGYPRYRRALIAAHYKHVPSLVRGLASQVSRRAAKLNVDINQQFHVQLMLNTTPASKMISTKSAAAAATLLGSIMEHKYSTFAADLSSVDAYIEADRHIWLPDESLMGTDKSTMAHGLEYRVPLLDQRLVAYARTIPRSRQLGYQKGKKLLRHAYADVLPQHVFTTQKRGWLSPAAKWMRDSEIQKVFREILSQGYGPALGPIVDWDVTERLLNDHVQGFGYNLNPLWNLAQLQVWARAHNLSL